MKINYKDNGIPNYSSYLISLLCSTVHRIAHNFHCFSYLYSINIAMGQSLAVTYSKHNSIVEVTARINDKYIWNYMYTK